ncbi:MAG: hypothetical protein M9928_15635 [Anaerolineae bacterium]|nr:hypothetical protein [Anaerolineae bacterium]MCO5194555.1 hypothetical protein [Anaerolineae bacterium]MCO5199628.1 hypothetical protein [Anaerolineae bacterium]MCO5206468.1 hypothetical protein [Anaerolineae bacterium]
MAIARQTDASKIKPLSGSIVRRYTAGAAIEAGEIVAMQADGYVDPANTTAAAATVVGIALSAAAVGDSIDVVVYGPVSSITGGAPGTTLHASDTAGEPAESAGSNAGIAGFVESATVAFVRPVHA